jgi:hypothetical protein
MAAQRFEGHWISPFIAPIIILLFYTLRRAVLPERSGMHDPPREWAANDALRKPRGFNQPVKINAGCNAHFVTEKYHIFGADIPRAARIAMASEGTATQARH